MNARLGVERVATGRPRSLRDVVALGRDAPSRFMLLREFMDEFYEESDPKLRDEMLRAEPVRIDDLRFNAYVAAVAEHLAFRNRLAVPDWSQDEARFLKRPWFPSGLESLKAIALMEGPTAFRRRMIFVGDDPLYRPRRDKSGIG